jgi:hypothetical protein
MGTLFVDKLDPQSGTSLEIGSNGDTITIPSGATIANSGTATGFGGTNTPSFSARNSSDQTGINTNSVTKVTFGTEDVDTDNAFASSRFTVPSGKAGKYFLTSTLTVLASSGVTNLRLLSLRIYKNGSQFDGTQIQNDYRNNYSYIGTVSMSLILDLAVSDYIEIYVRVLDEADGNNSTAIGNQCVFSGYKLL